MSTKTADLNTVKSKNISYYIGIIVGLFFLFGFRLVVSGWGAPVVVDGVTTTVVTNTGVTNTGVTAIGFLAGLIILISVSGNLLWPPLLTLTAFVLTDYMPATQMITSFLGNVTIYQLLIIMLLTHALRVSGAGEVLAKWILTRKFIQGRPMAMTLFILLAFMVGDFILTSMAGILFSFAVFDAICETIGLDKKSKYAKYMFIGLFCVAMLAPSILPFAGMPLAMNNNFDVQLQNVGLSLNYGTYMVVATIVCALFCVFFAFCLKFVFRCDMSKLKELDVTKMEGMDKDSIKLNPRQILYILCFVLGISYTIIMTFLPKETQNPLLAKYMSISLGVWFTLIVVTLALIRDRNGKPLLDIEAGFKSIPWFYVTTIGTFALIGAGISSDAAGVRAWLVDILSPLFSTAGFFIFMFIICFAATVLTNFFSNMATGIIIGSLAAPFMPAFMASNGINPSVVAVAIVFCSQFAFVTFSASGTCPLLLARPEMDTKFVWTGGWAVVGAYIVFATVVFSLLAIAF